MSEPSPDELYSYSILWHLPGKPMQRTVLTLTSRRRPADGFLRRYVASQQWGSHAGSDKIVIDSVKIRRIDE